MAALKARWEPNADTKDAAIRSLVLSLSPHAPTRMYAAVIEAAALAAQAERIMKLCESARESEGLQARAADLEAALRAEIVKLQREVG